MTVGLPTQGSSPAHLTSSELPSLISIPDVHREQSPVSSTACQAQVLVPWTAVKVASAPNKPQILRVPVEHLIFSIDQSSTMTNLTRILSIVDAGYRSESYAVSVFHSSSLVEEVIGTTSPFEPSDSEFCGWLPADASSCLAGGWSSGAFALASDVRSVKLATAYTSRYTGRGSCNLLFGLMRSDLKYTT